MTIKVFKRLPFPVECEDAPCMEFGNLTAVNMMGGYIHAVETVNGENHPVQLRLDFQNYAYEISQED